MKKFANSIAGVAALFLGLQAASAAAQGTGGRWELNQYDIGPGSQRIMLDYLEQDKSLFAMVCSNTGDKVLVRADAGGNLQHGQLTAVQAVVDGGALQIDGTYFNEPGGNPGVYQSFDITKPFFLSFPHSNQLKFGIPGQDYVHADMNADRPIFNRFIGLCSFLISDFREKLNAAQAQPQQQPASPGNDASTQMQTGAQNNGAAAGQGGSQTSTADNGDLGGLLLGAAALGAAVLANDLADQMFTEAPAPNTSVGDQNWLTNVRIVSVRAIETTFGFGGDEIFLIASNGQRFPGNAQSAQDIDAGETWSPDVAFSAPGGLSIDLREYDSVSASDLIGNFAVTDALAPGRYTSSMRGDGANYEIVYDVSFSPATVADPVPQPSPDPVPEQRVWSVRNSGDAILAADCQGDCSQDIGVLFICQGAGLPAAVAMPWALMDPGPVNAYRPLQIVVDGQVFEFSARLNNDGQSGRVPFIDIYPGDPVIEALQAGSAADIYFEGQQKRIGLRGSRDSLDIFSAHCSWSQNAGTDAGSDAPQPNWFVSNYANEQGQPMMNLTFGIPETDAVSFNATCRPGQQMRSIPVDLLVDTRGLQHGDIAAVYIQTSTATFQYQGQVFAQNSEWAGIRVNIPVADKVWRSLQNETQLISYGVSGAQQSTSATNGNFAAFGAFMATCSIANQAQQTPGFTPPIVRQFDPPVSGQQPAGGFAVGYICEDGNRLLVTTSAAGAATVANVQMAGAQYALIAVPSQIGKRYSNGEATLVVSGTTAQFTAVGRTMLCAQN